MNTVGKSRNPSEIITGGLHLCREPAVRDGTFCVKQGNLLHKNEHVCIQMENRFTMQAEIAIINVNSEKMFYMLCCMLQSDNLPPP
jgi:hypothetical protein